MCGIIGAVAKQPVENMLINGLKMLEYRGYDSAGIALIEQQQHIKRLRVVGKVHELKNALDAQPLSGHTGIAHTRWATHGVPSEKNAHPFISHDEFALVHNGIIENYSELRDQLKQAGYVFHSETDTEVVVHCIHHHFLQTKDWLLAIRLTVNELKGAYALGVISKHYPNRLIAVRQGSPLAIGKGEGINFITSDPNALLSLTNQFIYLEDYDLADITFDAINIYNKDQQPINRSLHTLSTATNVMDRGKYRHYMLKEIMEQPDAIAACLEGQITADQVLSGIFGPKIEAILPQVEHLQLVACGTSYHAALIARYWFESLTNIPCSVEVASEFRYRPIAKPKNSLFITLSQSGETADSLAAMRLAKQMGYLSTLAICNAAGSTMTREADAHFLTRAGIEIGVASTKAFTTQLIALFLLALTLQKKQKPDHEMESQLIKHLIELPALMKKTLQLDKAIVAWAKLLVDKKHAIYIGRGTLYPLAIEGALKMKEISYIHAEAYPSGELKHGPLALVDTHMPVIAMLPNDAWIEKNLSNLQEINARGGELYVLTDDQSPTRHIIPDTHTIVMPSTHSLLNPILYSIPLQLLAYHAAVLKGTDVDQPRNLAKSVTVE